MKLLIASKGEDPSIISLVVSQFEKMLILLEEPLKAAGCRVLRCDGSMKMKRREIIQEFEKSGVGSSTALLAGPCAGINLITASRSRAYLLDYWWKPDMEDQAIEMINRIG
ncbi:DNA helicase protein [Dioscorea alata]|uniref:DNA helicase protein n=1 Tax=Dioscorea alata TaxID=55571 RepID=A0ACB7VSD2_DIOAL|nr:DNA helicase protein [Dioscorea alata]